MLIALRNLFRDKTRLALSIGGVALAVMLALVLNGFLAGLTAQIGAYLIHEPGTLVVTQDGVENLLGVASQVPAGTADTVRSRGAKQVIAVLSQSVIFEMHDRKQFAFLIGYEPQTGGGPWQLAAGREPRNDKEIIFDSVLAQRHEIELGNQVDLMNEKFTVVGLSAGTNSWMTGFLFVRKTALESLLRTPGATSFLLVRPSDRIGTEGLRARLKDLSDVNVLTKEQVIANDVTLFGKALIGPIQVMAAIAFLVGALVVGLVIYTATVERQRE